MHYCSLFIELFEWLLLFVHLAVYQLPCWLTLWAAGYLNFRNGMNSEWRDEVLIYRSICLTIPQTTTQFNTEEQCSPHNTIRFMHNSGSCMHDHVHTHAQAHKHTCVHIMYTLINKQRHMHSHIKSQDEYIQRVEVLTLTHSLSSRPRLPLYILKYSELYIIYYIYYIYIYILYNI